MARVLSLNSALVATPASGIRRIVSAADARRAQGLPVYAFHLGEPAFDTPEPAKRGAIEALEKGMVHYAPNAGIPELREAIAADLNNRYGSSLRAASVVVTVGACEAISLALLAVLEPGDEVLVPTPCWPNYLHLPGLFGARAVPVPTRAEDGFRLSPNDLVPHINERTRAVVINTPNNPTGAMLSRDTLVELFDLAHRHQLWIIADEIYQDIIYDGHEFQSSLSLWNSNDCLIHVGGFSKSYAMTGWRLGYVVAEEGVARSLNTLHQYLVTSATSFTQWGALKVLQERGSCELMRKTYEQHRAIVADALRDAGLQFILPEGAFYTFVKVPDCFDSAQEFCERILIDYGLAFVPGNVFGPGHDGWFRLCFAGPTDEVLTGMNQLRRAILDLSQSYQGSRQPVAQGLTTS